MKLKASLIKKFIFTSMFAFVLIGSFLSYVINIEIRQYLIKDIKEDIANPVSEQTQLYVPQKAFSKPDILQHKDSFKKLENALGYTHFEKLKIYDSDGTIIYSNEVGLVGQNFQNDELDEAFDKGSPVAEILKKGDKREERRSTPFKKSSNQYMELYIPINYGNDTHVDGLVEIYKNIDDSLEAIRKIQETIVFSVATTFFVLFILLYWIFKKASNTIVEKNRMLFTTTKSLKIEQEQDEAIMKSMGEGLAVINKDGQILLYNPRVEAITGYSTDEVTFRHYKNFIDLRDKNGRKLKENYIRMSLKQGLIVSKSHREGICIKNKKGDLTPVSLTIAPIFGKDAKMRGLVFNVRDASIEKELDKVKDEFVYVVAHELGNPIFAVNGYLSMVLDGSLGKINAKVKDSLQTASQVNKQLATLVTDLLEVIRSASGKMEIEIEPTDITEVAEDVVKSLILKAKEKGIKISYEKKKLPNVLSNKDKLREILTNLIDNAVKYSPKNTEIKVEYIRTKDRIVTSVADKGYGMTRSERKHLFEKFYRIKNEDTSHITGTGLGLFIVKALVEKMHGDLWVESERGKGSTFSFGLDIAKK